MQNRPIIIGVTGGSGGGKTSVSRAILSHFPDEKISMIEHDSYSVSYTHLDVYKRQVVFKEQVLRMTILFVS